MRPDLAVELPAARPRAHLIVSIHDVSPLTRQKTEEILCDLEAVGVRSVSLLVVPDHHRKAPIQGDETFRAWLTGVAGGREIVAHGFFHLRESRAGAGAGERLVTSVYTAGEGEFYDLPEAEARRRLRLGREWLEWCGFSPSGFIAPAWLLGEEALCAVRAEGFEYTTRLTEIEPLLPGRQALRSQSLVWSVRSPWRRQVSLLWNEILSRWLGSNPVLRIGIHPPDWDFPKIRAQILRLTRQALAGRVAITYEDWVRSVQP